MIVIVEPSSDPAERISRLLGEHTTKVVPDLVAATAELDRAGGQARIVVLGPSLPDSGVLSFAEKLEHEHHGVATLLVTETLDAQLLREALRSGIDDVLTVQAPAAEWEEAIARANARLASEQDSADDHERSGKVISVFSTKGGCGKSLIASNLAVLVSERMKAQTALVDLDLQSGDLAIMFQLMPALSIYDAALDVDRLDQEAIQGYLTPHRSGVALLAAPLEPSLAEQVEPRAVTAILGLLPTMFGVTIIDGPPLFTEQMLAALDLSDEIILVGSMDVPSIKNLKLAVNTITKLGHPRERLRIVLNRADSKVGLRATEVEKSLGVVIDVQIPSSRDVPLSINQGTPLAISRPRSPVVQAISQLAAHIVPDAVAGRSGRTRRR